MSHLSAYFGALDVIVEVVSEGVDAVDGLVPRVLILEMPGKQNCMGTQSVRTRRCPD